MIFGKVVFCRFTVASKSSNPQISNYQMPANYCHFIGITYHKMDHKYATSVIKHQVQELQYYMWIISSSTGLITETGKSPIVGLFFLNMWGDCQVVPYHPVRTLSVNSEGKLEDVIKRVGNKVQQKQKEQSTSNCPQHYAIIVDETQIKVYLYLTLCAFLVKLIIYFLSFHSHLVFLVSIRLATVSHLSPRKVLFFVVNISLAMVRVNDQYHCISLNSYLYITDLPCLSSVTSCHHLLVHSLPGLNPLMKLQYSPLCEAMTMCTFRVSGMGQALYMSSPSEIQRLSIVKEDM